MKNIFQDRLHLGPERPARRLFVLGQRLHGRLVADAGQVGVGLPVAERLADEGLVRGLAGFGLLGPQGQVGLEPDAGLVAPGSLRLFVERRLVDPLAGARQRRGAGGVVAVGGFPVLGQLGVGLKCLGEEPGRWAELLGLVSE